MTLALTASTVLMFCISTIHFGAMIEYTFTEFLYHDAANKAPLTLFHPGDPTICTAIALEFANVSAPCSLVKRARDVIVVL